MQFIKEIIKEIRKLFIPPKRKRKKSRTIGAGPKTKKKQTTRSRPRVTQPPTKGPVKKTAPKKVKTKPAQKKKKSPNRKVPHSNRKLGPLKKIVLKNEVSSPLVGSVTHYFSKINVVVLKIEKLELKIGDKINIKGKVTDFIQKVNSLQIESVDVKVAKRGQLVGLKVSKSVQVGDKCYKLS
ncbi:MAG: hypothetical protein AB7S78_11840 [Candidatus Omnitrophota bacterium]